MTPGPLTPWLWPLLPPAVVALASALLPLLLLWWWEGRGSASLLSVLLVLGGAALGTLTAVLVPLLIALLALRARAARDGAWRLRLAAFQGLCLGASGSVVLYGLGQLFGLAQPPLLLALFLAFPVVGYGVGRWWGQQSVGG